MDYEVLVVGGGIAGMESALTLADMGRRVLVVEKEASIGGKMILLSKVFPTLDCSSCISTPKMAAVAHHPNITLRTSSEVRAIRRRPDGSFEVALHSRPTFVDAAACTGCVQCETVCSVAASDPFNEHLIAHRAVHIPFPQAVPRKAVIEHAGSSPCSAACPAGVKAHGFVSLTRAGRYEEAFQLHMEDAPLPGSLSRACYAPCEAECSRGEFEGGLAIRAVKRFMVDRYYAEHPAPPWGPPETARGERVAIVGSGPAGLTAAFYLARQGYRVTLFEAAAEPGGMLRYGIPAYRLPRPVLDRDVANVLALGVEMRTNCRVDSPASLRRQGFDAVLVAAGTWKARRLGLECDDEEHALGCLEFLQAASQGRPLDVRGKRVILVGGGNSCVDPARMAIRLGAARATVLYRRTRDEMPAHAWEVKAAEDEGVEFEFLRLPTRLAGQDGRLTGVECISMKLGEPDAGGRPRPVPIPGSEQVLPADMIVVAIGLAPDTAAFAGELELDASGAIRVDPETLATSAPGVFAAGDVVTGPSMIVNAVGQGRRAAFHIDRHLRGATEPALFDRRLPAVDRAAVAERSRSVSRQPPAERPERPVAERIRAFEEVELPLAEEAVRTEANRCLDCGGCSECHACVNACPAHSIDLGQRPREANLAVGSVILATGFRPFDPEEKPLLGFARHPNVITAMQMDRLLAPTRPYDAVLRPSDGKLPESVAYVLCVGSRDEKAGNRACSRVCCMYSLKQAQLLMGALPLADITVYYIDIRAFGKGYDEFFVQTQAMGTNFVRGRVARIRSAGESGNLTVEFEDLDGGGGLRRAEHDLVVLSTGLLPNPEPLQMIQGETLAADELAFVREIDEELDPCVTSVPGVFVAGTASVARDIPDTILHAGAASAQAAAYLDSRGGAR